jgi:hypothetical protein
MACQSLAMKGTPFHKSIIAGVAVMGLVDGNAQ